jgi:hypothetical protein
LLDVLNTDESEPQKPEKKLGKESRIKSLPKLPPKSKNKGKQKSASPAPMKNLKSGLDN